MNEDQKAQVGKSRAYGLVRGACEGLLLRLPQNERYTVTKLLAEADALWDGELPIEKDDD